MKIPCKIDTHNWYWNRKIQLYLFSAGIGWPLNRSFKLFSVRTRRYLVVDYGIKGPYIAWTTKSQYDALNFIEYNAKEFLLK